MVSLTAQAIQIIDSGAIPIIKVFQLVRGGGVRLYVLHLREVFFMETIIVVQLCVEP